MNFEDQLLSILNSCDKEQLNKYLNDEEAADTLVKSMDQYQSILREKEMLYVTNKQLAESNLKLEPKLNEAKLKLKECIQEFEKEKNDYLSLKETYEAQMLANGDISLDSIYNELKTASIKAEEETEKLADDFFCNHNGTHTDEELNAFQKQFIEQRNQAHLLKIKSDKMKELMSK